MPFTAMANTLIWREDNELTKINVRVYVDILLI